MNRASLPAVTTALALLLAGATATQVARPTSAPAIRLEVFPEHVHLPHRYASSQLLVTAVHPDGSRVDVTRYVEWDLQGSQLTIDERGRIRCADPTTSESLHTRAVAHFAGQSAGLDFAFEPTTEFEPGFAEHVQPALTRLGCNTGTCHGSAEGQNGFQLSLRGYDPLADHRALTDDLAGRRFDPTAPAESLFLLKPLGAVPHEGGKLLDRSEPDYALIRDWVAGGATLEPEPVTVTGLEVFPSDPTLKGPGSEQQFAVHATFSDGSVRDVTEHAFLETANVEVLDIDDGGLVTAKRRGEAAVLARYQGAYAATRLFVMGDREGFHWQPVAQNGWIDELVDARLETIKTLPSETCSDAEFLRRIHLDLTGLLPTMADVETFLLDTRAERTKRDEVVDRLLGSTAFVEHWTNRQADLLQVNPKYLSQEGARRLHGWIKQQIASNRPYDAFVRDLIASSGSTWDDPPTAFHKIHREPDAAMEATTQLFLGVRFNCNKCHDHPFEKWTQAQHWSLAAVFADVKREDVAGRGRMPKAIDAPKDQQAPTVEERIGDLGKADPARVPTVQDPDGRSYGPSFPFQHDGSLPADATHRERLAAWLTAPENPLFAKSYVNRIWSYLLGRGLIEPVDDIRAGNPPSHPVLLDQLTRDFIDSGFDVRRLIATICKTRTYQRSVRPNRWNADDDTHFARAIPRRLPAEVLFDVVHQATGSEPRIAGTRPGTRARDLIDPGVKAGDGFLDLFGRPARESVCECERADGLSLGQALSMVNGPTFAEAVRDPGNEVVELAAAESDPRRIVRELYLRFLSRPPSDAELAAIAPTVDPDDPGTVDALPPEERNRFRQEFEAWAGALRETAWHEAELGTVRADSGVPFTRLDDGSVVAGGEAPDKDVYTATVFTDVWPIHGLRLEVLPHESLPKNGPGRAGSGNFVLGHLSAQLIPLADATKSRPLQLTTATADFSQQNYPAEKALTPEDDGWALHPEAGKRHVLVVETASDAATPPPGGHLIALRMTFPYGGQHVLGRFRVQVTDSDRPIRHGGLDDELLAVVRTPAAERTPEQLAVLHRHYLKQAAAWRAPLREAATQDLAWSLANSPAFLFNR